MFLMSLPVYLAWPAAFCAVVSFQTWIHSIITSNVSQVDRLWTSLPPIYTAYYALLPLWPHKQLFWLAPYVPEELTHAAASFSPRALLMLGLTVIWMCRLNYNTWRRGLFKQSEEDYRWAVLRKRISPFLFQVTNIVFISIIQNILLLLLGLPTYAATVLQPHSPLALSDYILALAALVILALEFTADNQQYAFHAYKHAYLAQKTDKNAEQYDPTKHWAGARLNWCPQDAERGFCTRGLWAYARHPNFACEQTFWTIITLFPLLSPTAQPISYRSFPLSHLFDMNRRAEIVHYVRTDFATLLWYILPALSLCLLFKSSTRFTESITAEKYPAYKAYQKRVGMFSPLETMVWKRLHVFIFGGGKKELDGLDQMLWNSKKVD